MNKETEIKKVFKMVNDKYKIENKKENGMLCEDVVRFAKMLLEAYDREEAYFRWMEDLREDIERVNGSIRKYKYIKSEVIENDK